MWHKLEVKNQNVFFLEALKAVFYVILETAYNIYVSIPKSDGLTFKYLILIIWTDNERERDIPVLVDLQHETNPWIASVRSGGWVWQSGHFIYLKNIIIFFCHIISMCDNW